MIVPIHDCTPTPNFYLFKLLKKFLILFVGGHALDFFKTILKAYKFTSEVASLGVTSIEKIPKISTSGQNFLNPSSPLWKRALPTKLYLMFSNYKVCFFSKNHLFQKIQKIGLFSIIIFRSNWDFLVGGYKGLLMQLILNLYGGSLIFWYWII